MFFYLSDAKERNALWKKNTRLATPVRQWLFWTTGAFATSYKSVRVVCVPHRELRRKNCLMRKWLRVQHSPHPDAIHTESSSQWCTYETSSCLLYRKSLVYACSHTCIKHRKSICIWYCFDLCFCGCIFPELLFFLYEQTVSPRAPAMGIRKTRNA